MKKLLALALTCFAAFAAEGYHVITKIKVGGQNGWDYLAYDPASNRLFVSNTDRAVVIDVGAGKVVGEIPGTQGIHGIALVPGANKGYTSNGRGNNVTVFDLKTLQKIGDIPTGENPDSICYEPKTQRVFTFNGRSKDTSAIDVKSGKVVATVGLGAKPEFCQADGTGKVYVNLEDTNELAEIDAATPVVARKVKLDQCDAPSGLAIDRKDRKLFSVCENKMMAITDIPSMRVVGTAPIGAGTDGAGFDSGLGLAFSSNGGDGTLSIVKAANGKYETVDTVPTERGARTIAVDEKNHRVFMTAAEYTPVQTAPDGKKSRPRIAPDSVHILVVGK
jgi:YVTN family beta-propeller protein